MIWQNYNTETLVKILSYIISYQTMPAGLPAPQWLDRSLQASLLLPSSYWPKVGSQAATHKQFLRMICFLFTCIPLAFSFFCKMSKTQILIPSS